MIGSLAPFDSPESIAHAIETLVARGWVEERDGVLSATPFGTRRHAELAPLVEGVRERVRAALPGDDYPTLVRLLAQLTDGL